MSMVQQSTVRVQIPGSDLERTKRDEESVGVDEVSRENTGRWTQEEHNMFLQGLKDHGKGWKKIASLIKTRTVVQIRTHAQKYFQKLSKAKQGEVVPMSVDVRSAALSPRKTKKKPTFAPMKPTNPPKPVNLPHRGMSMQQHGMRSGVVPSHNVGMVQQPVYMNGSNSSVPATGMMISLPSNPPMENSVTLDKIVLPSNSMGAEGSPVSIADMGFMYPNSGPGSPSSAGHQSPVSPPFQYSNPTTTAPVVMNSSSNRGAHTVNTGESMYTGPVERPSYSTSSAPGGGWSHAIAASAHAMVSGTAPAVRREVGGVADVKPYSNVQRDMEWGAQDVGNTSSFGFKRSRDEEFDQGMKRRRVDSPSLASDSSDSSYGGSIAPSPYSTIFPDAAAVDSISPITYNSPLSSLASEMGEDCLDFLWDDDEPLNLDDVFRNCLDEHVFNASLLCGGGLEGVF